MSTTTEPRDPRLRLGDWNELTITRFTDHGAYLDGGLVGEVLMPRAFVAPTMHAGDSVRVFLYLDQSERLVATTEQPLARVGEFAFLRTAWVNEYGAFLSWGVQKDLFVPFREQKQTMSEGRSYIVRLYIDEATGRIVGTAKVDKWLRPVEPDRYRRGDAVEVLVWMKSPLGLKVIVDNAYAGLIYADRLHGREPRTGDRLTAYVETVRPDGRLDISPEAIGVARFRDFSEELLAALRTAGGVIPLSDSSDPALIAQRFGVSKKTFKRALGTLYRRGLVQLLPDETRLVSED